MRAVAQRWVGAPFAEAEEYLAVLLRSKLDRLEVRTLMRAVTERLILEPPATAPPNGLARFQLHRHGLSAGNSRLTL